MKETFSPPRRPITPRYRLELRGSRRARPPRRNGIRTRCGYMLFTNFV